MRKLSEHPARVVARAVMSHSNLSRQLQLLQLADSGVPIGSLAHSFGLETMIEEGLITVDGLLPYLANALEENLLLEAVYCRTAHFFAGSDQRLNELNAGLSALRMARESREASLSLGKRFIHLVASFEPALQILAAANLGEIHFSIAFGYVGGVLCFNADETVAAFLHQNVATSLSAAQRLLSLGQMQSSRMAWELKPLIAEAVSRSSRLDIQTVASFSHLPELASMRHPCLPTRLFIS
jgi:urease accessory protein